MIPLSIITPVEGSASLLSTARLGVGSCLNFPILFNTSADCGPDTLTTATPHLPCPEDSENIVPSYENNFFVLQNPLDKCTVLVALIKHLDKYDEVNMFCIVPLDLLLSICLCFS